MIGVATTGELSPTRIGVDGDDFDVFSSLRDGAGGEDFSSGIGETVADSVERLDLVAVASGKEELPSTEEVSASIGQTACVTCVGCPYLSQCVKPQALVMKQESERQENVSSDMNSAGEEAVPNLMEMTPKQSYLDRLLAPDDLDSLDENGRGELVMAGYSGSTDYQESIIKKAPEPVVAKTKPIDLATKADEPTEQIVQQKRENKTSTNETVEALGKDLNIEVTEVSSPSTGMKPHIIDAISDATHDDNRQPISESLDTPTQTETAPVSVVIDKNTQTVDDNSNSLEHETVYPAASDDKVAASFVEPKPSRAAENDESAFTSISEQQHLEAQFDAVKADKSAITGPIDNSGTKAPVYTQSSEINIDATPDQIFTDTQILSIEPLDYINVAVERSHGKDDEFWAEEDAVFFVDQQESLVVEPEVPSAEAVTIVLPVETFTAREETDDYEPLHQVAISTLPIIDPIPDVESDEVAAKISEECPVSREECEFMFVKTSEKSDLLRSDDEIESVLMYISDIKSGINLSGEQAELKDILDDCAYNGEESVANGDDLLMNTHPSSGLWSDDSRLNPEDGVVSTAQSSADDTSLVSRLVGVFVVAMCVVCGRQARFILNS
ncbi:hypothetical protein TM074_03630 [Candidatus Nanosynbacter sp. TM7-074]|uniref:Uncharacterized protein n=1 Tax=Candidatus Nanosynbacter sp. TM7-074 TaxID=3158573 RepID=A0AB39JC73_9BACT